MLFALLTACTEPQVVEKLVYVPTVIPERLKTCPKIPVSPANNPAATQADVAVYIVNLHYTAVDCKRKLAGVVSVAEAATVPAPQ